MQTESVFHVAAVAWKSRLGGSAGPGQALDARKQTQALSCRQWAPQDVLDKGGLTFEEVALATQRRMGWRERLGEEVAARASPERG